VQTGVRLVIAADTGIRRTSCFFALLLLLNIRTRTPCFIDGAEYAREQSSEEINCSGCRALGGESMGQHTKE
jgi:hypothetical protein